MLGRLKRFWLLAAVGLVTSTGSAFACGAEDLTYLNNPKFEIPVRIDQAQRAKIREVVLCASIDEGKNWKRVDAIAPDKCGIPFSASKDGLYWFTIQVVYKNGKVEPTKPRVADALKVVVDTTKPDIRLTATKSGDTIQVAWEIAEDNPDKPTLRLDYQAAERSALPIWTPLCLEPGRQGIVKFHPPNQGAVKVRMQLMDLAGNVGVAETIVPAKAPEVCQIHRKLSVPMAEECGEEPPQPVEAIADPTVEKSGDDFLKEVNRELVALLVKKYQQACREGRVVEAQKLAWQALVLDPTCFSEDR